VHQNDMKTQKNINLKKIIIIIFFKSVFETQKQIGFNKIQLKKYLKTTS
jgi:hypothetical protein